MNLQEPLIEFQVWGTPAPQGSKSAFRNRYSGKIQQVESSKAVAPWRQDVKAAAILALEERWPGRTLLPVLGPLVCSMVFSFERPKGHFRVSRGYATGEVKESAPDYPATRPDLSKLIRSTEDAMTAVVWKDDAQVVGYLHLAKVYCNSGMPDALPRPGAVIRVWSVPKGWGREPTTQPFATVMEGS